MARVQRALLGAGLLMVAVLFLPGCRPPPTKVGFNNTLAEYNEKLFAVGRKFRTVIRPLAYPEENKKAAEAIDPAAVRKVQKEAVDAVNEVRDDFDSLGYPRRNELGKKLREAYENFLKVQEKIANDYFKEIADIVESDKSNDEKGEEIRAIIKKIDDEESEVAGKLADAQKDYATNQSMRIDPANALKGGKGAGGQAMPGGEGGGGGGGKPGPGGPKGGGPPPMPQGGGKKGP
jgi:hypothetical protein